MALRGENDAGDAFCLEAEGYDQHLGCLCDECPELGALVGVLGEVDELDRFEEVDGELAVDSEKVEGCGKAKFLIPIVVSLKEIDVAAERTNPLEVVFLMVDGVGKHCEVSGLVDGGEDETLCDV